LKNNWSKKGLEVWLKWYSTYIASARPQVHIAVLLSLPPNKTKGRREGEREGRRQGPGY
jgi:hypothetical protein